MFTADNPLMKPTAYDLGFRLWGYFVRVHPLFWVVMTLLGFLMAERDLFFVMLFILSGFVSILLHEFGHGLTARAFRCDPVEIVLHLMGGHCAYSPGRTLGIWRRVAITAAGPMVNVLLALISFGLIKTLQPAASSRVSDLLFIMLTINVIWGLFNILPIFPMDGSRIAIALMELRFPRRAMEWGIYLSIATLIVTAIVAWRWGWLEGANWIILMILVFEQVMMLQAMRGQELIGKGGGGGGWSSMDDGDDDPADWWKR